MKLLEKFLRILFIALFIMIIFVLLYNPVMKKIYFYQKDQEVQHIMQQWSELNITKYQIGFTIFFYGGSCEQAFLMEANKIAQIIKKDCLGTSYSIATFFQYIRNAIAARDCNTENCLCNARNMDVVYDEKYHFPKSSHRPSYIPPTRGEAWPFKSALRFLEPKQMCVGGGDMSQINWEIHTFIPLKQ
jgi:hypothetical protein